jgi:hypothetical protein
MLAKSNLNKMLEQLYQKTSKITVVLLTTDIKQVKIVAKWWTSIANEKRCRWLIMTQRSIV